MNKKSSLWLSKKGIRYVLQPYRIGTTWVTINPKVCSTLTAKGQQNWIGTFIGPDIEKVDIYGARTRIKFKDGAEVFYDGSRFSYE